MFSYLSNIFFRLSLITTCCYSLTACSGGGGGGAVASGSSSAPAKPSVSISYSAIANEDQEYDLDFSNSTGTISSVAVVSGPSWLSYNSSSKRVLGTPTDYQSYPNMRFLVTFSDATIQTLGPYNLEVKYDPLSSFQWNLKNTGQSAFSATSGTAGIDMNVFAAHNLNVYGNSTPSLVVSDSRIDLTHEDLINNSDLASSKNYTNVSPYSGSPTSSADNAHGTTVASIMAAKGWNNIGIRGVCPICKIIGYNFLESDQTVSKQINQASNFNVSGYNYSYGANTCRFTPIDSSYISQVRNTTLSGRSARGINFVTSAGNDFNGPQGGSCNFTYLGNSNLDQAKSYPYFIVVGAINAQGVATTYSTPGANSWVVAPGGEGGQTQPGLIAADLEGCSSGSSKSTSTENAFESNANSLNSNCKYTSTATGTSFASPSVAGLVGLLLKVNSNLSWRDIKHIIAKTAKQVDPTATSTTHPLGSNLAGHTYQQGWVTNAAGYKFHNWYGFGLVDAVAAVSAAATYSSSLGTLVITENPYNFESLYSKNYLNLLIPDNSSIGITDQIYVRHNLKVEAVQIAISVSHTLASDLGVELTSPSGTKSILMNINSEIADSSLSNVTLLSNAFYGESSLGNWTIKVIDGAAADTGIITAWSVKVWGSKVSTSDKVVPNPITNLTGPSYYMSELVSPKFSWTASPSSDVLRYEYCIGTSASNCNISNWLGYSNSTAGQAYGGMTVGNTYFFNVRVIDTSENTSTIVSKSWVNDDGGTWSSMSTVNAPTAKTNASAVWTGSDLIISGGYSTSTLSETHKYNLVSNSWSSAAAAPVSYWNLPTVWTGSEMLLWSQDTGGTSKLKIYNPSTNVWSVATNTGSPANATGSSLIWTGSMAVVWGGGSNTNTGSRYTRGTNSWSATSTASVPTGRGYHSSVWIGSQMFIWGGWIGSSTYVNTGGKYNPTTNVWTTVSNAHALSARQFPAVVWTGSEVIVWGGSTGQTDGAIYNPSTNTWRAMSNLGAPYNCGETGMQMPAVWTGSKMIVAGCMSGYGAMYDLANDTWQLIKPPTSSRPNYGMVLSWTGSKLIIWGGYDSVRLNTGATYVP